MPVFPNNEAEVVVLAETMIAGYTAHPADFPSIDASAVSDLTSTLGNYQTDRNSQEDAKAQAKLATVAKDDKLDGLTELMKNDLKLSEVDVIDDPTKLAQIGWGARQQPQPVEGARSADEPAPGSRRSGNPLAGMGQPRFRRPGQKLCP